MTHSRNFRYKAITRSGSTVRGTLEADSSAMAIAQLQERGLTPLQLDEVRAFFHSGASLSERLLEMLRPVSAAEITAATRQLCTLLAAGLPLDEALEALCTEGRGNHLHSVLGRVRASLLEGVSFADGLARFPRIFSSTFVTMVRAGEESGTLDVVLERFAAHMEEQMALRRKVQTALAYPLLMLLIGAGVLFFLLSFVVPKVTQMFVDMNRELPLPTQILLFVSNACAAWGWLLPGGLVLSSAGLWRWLHTEAGRRFKDSFLLRVPGIRSIYRPLIVGHMTRTAGMLLKNGVPLLKTLHIVRSVSANGILGESIDNMREGVQTGKDLSFFMDNPRLFSPLERQMVAAGERGGQLGDMLLWVAKDCEARVAARLQIAATLLEPLMILLLGCVVGFVVIAIMLPLFEMSSLAG